MSMEQTARELRMRAGQVVFPFDLGAIAEAAGANLRPSPLVPGVLGLLYTSCLGPLILYRSRLRRAQRRVTIGHELGHLILEDESDRREGPCFYTPAAADDPRERNATRFSYVLNVPLAELDDVVGRHRMDEAEVDRVARVFDVPRDVVSSRMFDLRHWRWFHVER